MSHRRESIKERSPKRGQDCYQLKHVFCFHTYAILILEEVSSHILFFFAISGLWWTASQDTQHSSFDSLPFIQRLLQDPQLVADCHPWSFFCALPGERPPYVAWQVPSVLRTARRCSVPARQMLGRCCPPGWLPLPCQPLLCCLCGQTVDSCCLALSRGWPCSLAS